MRGAGADAEADADAAAAAEDKGNLRVLVLTFFFRNRWSVGAAAADAVLLPAALDFCDADAAAAPDPTDGKDRRGIGLEDALDAAILDELAAAGALAVATGATGGSFLRGMLFMIILAGGLPSLFESGFMATE
jgi:hypothetical protein